MPLSSVEPRSLTEALQKLRRDVEKQLPRETHARLSAAIDDLVRSDPAAGALRVGQFAPDFTLPDTAGRHVTLSAQLRAGPVVITFYRGSWCPYCDLALRAYSKMLPRLRDAGAQLIAISPQSPHAQVPNAVEHRDLGFPLLSDSDNRVARAYGLAYSVDALMRTVFGEFGLDLAAVNGASSWELPVPATLVVRPDSRIAWAYVETDFRLPAQPDDILRAVAAL